ncbi:hypothetical protein NQZ68_021620 [Dissostichus eleginoides]|nr:hypothetical protein NQZ68_021620 [Dissostichus eleginoides]
MTDSRRGGGGGGLSTPRGQSQETGSRVVKVKKAGRVVSPGSDAEWLSNVLALPVGGALPSQ